MEVPTVLLVALMFVTIVTTSIMTVISALASMIVQGSKAKRAGLHTSWLIYLLIAHLSLFWSTIDIGAQSDWLFGEFLLVIAGPVLAFFAVNTLLPSAAEDPEASLRDHYFNAARKFFVFFAGVQAWGIAMDWLLGHAWSAFGWINAGLFVVMMVMAFSRSARLHVAGTALAWAGLVAALLMRGAHQLSAG